MKVFIYNVDIAGIIKDAGFAIALRAGDLCAHKKKLPHLEYLRGWSEPPTYVLPNVSNIINNEDSVSFFGYGGMLLFKIGYYSFEFFECY